MGTEIIKDYGIILTIQSIAIMLFMLPDFSLILWKRLMKRWSLLQGKKIMRRNRKAEEKLKKYWEIDMRKSK